LCRQAKGTKKSFSGTVSRPSVKEKQSYADVKGPFTTPSLFHENLYVFGIIEATTRYIVQCYIKQKSDVHKFLKLWYEECVVSIRQTSS